MPASPTVVPVRAAPARPGGTAVVVAAVLDAVLVVVFAAIGRASHQEGDAVLGILGTAWPFLLGTVVGWLVVRVWRAPTRLVPQGLAVWVATVAVGVGLRVVTGGGGAPVSFVIVTTVVLAVFLLGWRGVATLARRPFRRRAVSPSEGA